MSWTKKRVYKCDVCGKLQPVSRYNHGAPAFWRHTGNRHGFTICDKCRDAIEWAADTHDKEQKQEQEQEQGQERYGGLVGSLQTMLYGGADDDKED